jgi:hypothetical protein
MKYILLTLVLLPLSLLAQNRDTTALVIHRDPRVEVLSKKQASINAAIKKSSARRMKGFRLLVINTTKRNDAIDAKTKVYTYFPELQAYLQYSTPYFKLKAGNFRTRDEAERYRKNLNIVFPKGVFIVNDTIEVTPEKDEQEVK